MALLVEYGFNEGGGSTAADSSGNGYNLTIGTGSWPAGYNGSGFTAGDNGTNAFSFGTGTITTYTVMFWIKRTGTVAAGDWRQAMYNGVVFIVDIWGDDNSLRIQYWDDTGLVQFSTGTLALNTWVHVTLTRSGTNAAIYKNGTLMVSSSTVGADTDYAMDRAAAWRIGNGNDGPFPGVMDEVRIFDTSLTAGDITTWMNTPAGGASPTLISWVI